MFFSILSCALVNYYYQETHGGGSKLRREKISLFCFSLFLGDQKDKKSDFCGKYTILLIFIKQTCLIMIFPHLREDLFINTGVNQQFSSFHQKQKERSHSQNSHSNNFLP